MFKKYNSIENHYRQKFINKIVECGLHNQDFVVLEKVHGANMAFYMSEDRLEVAKRTSFIEEGENFYHYETVVDKLEDNLLDFYQQVNGENVIIYGELCGGSYPGIKSNVKAVQKGVFYSPENEFVAFDLEIDGELVDYTEAVKLFKQHNIPHCEILFKGSLEDCLNYDIDFDSIVPSYFGLPKLEKPNRVEGVVIKPDKATFFNNGSRVIIKKKSKTFSEKVNEKAPKLPDVTLSETGQAMLEKVSQYVTENRLRNVISKIGEITNKDFGKLNGLFVEDILEDFFKDEDSKQIEKNERKVFNRQLQKQTIAMIRENFLDILDKEF